ncbi:MAG: hypothetical protein JO307_32900 [Bryobacterales bacterium]|nr:hypothetical protein [Bryobacterales bacterium]MBV9399220.1 hypothetical protein [Bryobacterales bacterium]
MTRYPPLPDRGIRYASLTRLAFGIEAGILGGFVMMGFLVLGSLFRDRVWWEMPNILGSTIYGIRAFRSGPGIITLSGAALHFVITGSIGALFGLACGSVRPRKRLILLGVVAGLLWYYVGQAIFWTRVNPWVTAYSSQPLSLIAHAIFGACLGWMGPRVEHADPEPNPQFSAPTDVEVVKDAVE